MAGSILKIDNEGKVVKCAKGLAPTECGYKAGAKVCGKCGALAVSVKANEDTKSDISFAELLAWDRNNPGKPAPRDFTSAETEQLQEMRESLLDFFAAHNSGGKKAAMAAAKTPEDGEMEEDEEEMEEGSKPASGPMGDEEEDEEDAPEGGAVEDMAKAKRRRMRSMGMKADDFEDGAYVCGIARKMHDAGQAPCSMCVGGCQPEGGMPSLLEIEGVAESLFDGKVLASGYAPDVDVFVVDVKAADGTVREAFFHGQTGECFRWSTTDADGIAEKSLGVETGEDVISPEHARDIALEHVQGKAVLVDVDVLDGEYVYVVEIEGEDEKSYDAYVSVKGDFIDYESYEREELDEINAEVAELHFKRMYSDEQRTQMAEQGMALPDGSYPIKDEADLRNAIQAFGRAKDKEKAKAHIMKRARDLGMEDMIPEQWSGGGDKMMGSGYDEAEEYTGMSGAKKRRPGAKSENAEILGSLVEFELMVAEEELKDIL